MCLFLGGRCKTPILELNCPASKLENRVYFDVKTKTCKTRRACSGYRGGTYFTYLWECHNVCEQLHNFNPELNKNDEETIRRLTTKDEDYTNYEDASEDKDSLKKLTHFKWSEFTFSGPMWA